MANYPIGKWASVTLWSYTSNYPVRVISASLVKNSQSYGLAEITDFSFEWVGSSYRTKWEVRIKPSQVADDCRVSISWETSAGTSAGLTGGDIDVVGNGIKYNGKWYTAEDIQSASTERTKSMVSEECGINTLSAVIYSEDIGASPLLTLYGENYAPNGYDSYVIAGGSDIRNYTPYAPVEIWKEGVLLGKYYLTSIERQAANWFKLDACSPIGILDKMTHKGGLYTNSTFTQIAQEIIGQAISYTIDSAIASIPVSGWLPYSTARENLNQLLFAVGAAATYGANGNMVFKYNEPDVSVDIPDANIYVGGSTDYPTKASKVTLIEHAWYQNDSTEAEVLYDNTGGTSVSNALVVFDRPCHTLVGTGLTVTAVNCNCCYVSGTGKLTGKAYDHTQRELTQEDENLTAQEMQVEDATLVSSLNSLNCLRRVFNYYRNANEVSYGIISDGSYKCGDLISFTDPFGEATTGYVKEMTETVSEIIKSETKIATNWIPKYLGNTYEHSMILKASDLVGGVWSVPQAMQGNPALVVLFGGFGGGQGGYNGDSGESTSFTIFDSGWQNYVPSAGMGGNAGTCGAYPKYIVGEYASLAASYSVAFGAGGAGGASNGGAGGQGGHSVFGTYDTDNGETLTGQYVNLIDGTVVASKGADGLAGGNGGETFSYNNRGSVIQTDYHDDDDKHYTWKKYGNMGGNGGSVGTYAGGAGAYGADSDYERDDHPNAGWQYNGAGCGGGGSAHGASGTAAFCNFGSQTGQANYAGNGASATAPANAELGKTGNGGNGGGGGGAGSINLCYLHTQGGNFLIQQAGNGGTGSAGSAGSPGFALIYY